METERLLNALRLLRLNFSKEQLQTPVLQFFEENFPNLEVVRNEKGNTEVLWKEKGLADGGGNIHAGLLHRMSMAYSDPSFGGFQFSGKAGNGDWQGCSQRMSVGMTPTTIRLPKQGEMLLSVRGSPLGVCKEEQEDHNMEAIHGILLLSLSPDLQSQKRVESWPVSFMMMENKLYDASFRGDIRALEELLRQDKLALNHCGTASRGHVDFAKVLLQHKPDLVNELDSRLRAPLHLASANGRVEMVKLLLNADSDVCLIEDEFGRTPFHLAAMVKGQVEVINELVRARPELVMYPLNRMKTVAILHLYVLRNGPKALDQLVEVDHTFLNSQDGEGNIILHKVVALKQLETLFSNLAFESRNLETGGPYAINTIEWRLILKYLADRAQLVMNLKNVNGFTALDIVKQMPRDPQTTKMCKLLLNAKLSSQDNKIKDNEKSLLEKKRDAMLIAATVITGMAYQAGLDPLGGVWDQNYQTILNIQGKNLTFLAGRSIMAVNYPREYRLFWAFNTMSFVTSLSIVLLLIHGSPSMGTTWFCVLKQKVFMRFLTVVIWVVATTMTLTYLVAMLTITPGNAIKFNIDNLGFKVEGRGTGDIIILSVLAWLGLVCIVFIMNAAHFFGRIIVKVVTCINRSGRNANEGEHQGNSNANNTTSCTSV
ncbi:hypothetical protein LguiB_016635 [Lonicera macranthoides]